MLDFGGTAQKLWVLHCLDSFLPFLLVANLGLHSSFAVSRLAYLGFQSKEIVIDMLPHTGCVGVLGTGVPRLACLRPTAWLCKWARTAHLHQQAFKTLARRATQDLLGRGLTRLAREGQRDQGKGYLARFPVT